MKLRFLFPEHFRNATIAKLKPGDSLTFYQCHVTEASQYLVTASGEKIEGKAQKYTVTEKYVVINKLGSYRMKYYTSSLSDFPNKKFAYLKLKEKDYWNFKLFKDTLISDHDVLMFAAIELKSHDTIEYDFRITKYNTNQIIINGRKVMRHLVVDGNYTLKKNLESLH